MESRPFSERMGLVPVVVQIDGMDAALRNSIWNFISRLLEMPKDERFHIRQGDRERTRQSVEMIADAILRVPVQDVEYQREVGWLLDRFHELEWHRVYDMLEHVAAGAHFITNGRVAPRD